MSNNHNMEAEHAESWRIIHSPPSTGAENMALDDAVLEAVSAGSSPPTLRLYAWQPPCISIGFAQPLADIDRKRLREYGWDLVRRPTGGRAILHTDELTYAVIAPDNHPHLSGGVLRSYRTLSAALAEALAHLDLQVLVQPKGSLSEEQRTNPVCFQIPSTYEITVQGKKLIGSAQLRRNGAVLQHGTIPLHGDIARICDVLSFENDEARYIASGRVRQNAATVEALLEKPISWQQVAHALAKGFSNALGWKLELKGFSEAEMSRAEILVSTRYDNSKWIERI